MVDKCSTFAVRWCCVMHRMPSIFQVIWNASVVIHCQDENRNSFHSSFWLVAFVCEHDYRFSMYLFCLTHNWCTLFFPSTWSYYIALCMNFLRAFIVFHLNVVHSHTHTRCLVGLQRKTHFIARICFSFPFSFFYAHSFNWIWGVERTRRHSVFTHRLRRRRRTKIGVTFVRVIDFIWPTALPTYCLFDKKSRIATNPKIQMPLWVKQKNITQNVIHHWLACTGMMMMVFNHAI